MKKTFDELYNTVLGENTIPTQQPTTPTTTTPTTTQTPSNTASQPPTPQQTNNANQPHADLKQAIISAKDDTGFNNVLNLLKTNYNVDLSKITPQQQQNAANQQTK